MVTLTSSCVRTAFPHRSSAHPEGQPAPPSYVNSPTRPPSLHAWKSLKCLPVSPSLRGWHSSEATRLHGTGQDSSLPSLHEDAVTPAQHDNITMPFPNRTGISSNLQ
ncbi:hypothetical protein DPEC_G00064160 [Dallia pectoralis]|uniref:Uncharacterized protein n=1 Tax=Dallia pectoralis TaxID=75939 RepID=A0ACC2H7X4_DALPE|nr:hypothetical protein DPEC_G00064160 [Dallia pectoralis]